MWVKAFAGRMTSGGAYREPLELKAPKRRAALGLPASASVPLNMSKSHPASCALLLWEMMWLYGSTLVVLIQNETENRSVFISGTFIISIDSLYSARISTALPSLPSTNIVLLVVSG